MQERDKKVGKKTIEKNAITEGVIWKQLLIFFFPIMLGTLIQQLYTTVDTIIVGRFVGKGGTCKCRRTGSRIIDDRCYLLQWSGEWGGSYYRTILWCKGQEEPARGDTYSISVLCRDQFDRIIDRYSIDTLAA